MREVILKDDSLNDEELFVLELFDLKLLNSKANYKNEMEYVFTYSLMKDLQICVVVVNRYDLYYYVRDFENKIYLVYVDSVGGRRLEAIKILCLNLKNYSKQFIAHRIYTNIKKSIVQTQNGSVQTLDGKILSKISIEKVVKRYEDGKWKGVDKDAYFTEYIETIYYLKLNDVFIEDPYIRSILPSSTLEIESEGFDSKASTQKKPTEYCLEPTSKEIFDEFVSVYNKAKHNEFTAIKTEKI